MKSLVLRFDVDTYRCINEGVPNLLRLAREEQVKFVFFCNMGRATSRLALLGRLLRRRPASAGEGRAKRLPASVKLGHYEALRTLLLDPKVGMSCPEPIRTAETEGHDIGLHGGRNHGTWQNGFHSWRTDRIQREVSAGKIMFERVLDRSPVLFSSPGWQGSDTLNAILKDAGFKASADRHGAKEEDLGCENGFCTLPTNLLAEPGGVAYFESLVARGLNSVQIVDEFRKTLGDGRQLYALYDHPCFAGTHALETIRAVVRCATQEGVEIVTFSELIRRKFGA